MTTPSPHRRLLLGLVLLALLAPVLGLAALRAAAAWQYFAATAIEEDMRAAREYTAPQLDAGLDRARRALALLPSHPDYLDLAGRLKTLSASQPGTVGQERRDLLHAAAADHRRALEIRPLWPYSWVNLLSVKDKLGEVDKEFNWAMRRAAATGPWEPRVQLQLIRSGVRWWDQLLGPEREIVLEMAARALRTQPREAFEIARFYVRPDLVCGRDTDQPQIERWCQNVL